jgi:hypothetical protein
MIVADTVKLDQYVYIKIGAYCIVSLFVNVTYHLMKYTENYYYSWGELVNGSRVITKPQNNM